MQDGLDKLPRWLRQGARWLREASRCLRQGGKIALWAGTATDIEDQRIAMEKKDKFIGIASQELKTPLTCLKG